MKIEKISSLMRLTSLLPVIANLEDTYPDVEHWYINKVIPRVMLDQDVVLTVTDDSNNIAGFAIGKNTDQEKKLCCLMILPQFQHAGYGFKLTKAMMKELNTDYPHCSVSEDLFHAYSRMFINHFGWSVDEVKKDVYVKGKLEYYFNGKEKETQEL